MLVVCCGELFLLCIFLDLFFKIVAFWMFFFFFLDVFFFFNIYALKFSDQLCFEGIAFFADSMNVFCRCTGLISSCLRYQK